jgi:hypothetical protein
MPDIVRQPVNSSNIKSVGHDKGTNTLEVEFHGRSVKDPTKIYRYSPVTETAYLEMIKADSIGGYFGKNIRNNPNITCNQIQ